MDVQAINGEKVNIIIVHLHVFVNVFFGLIFY